MAINFNSLGSNPSVATEAPVEVTATPGISLNLEKNSILNLDKVAPGLENVDLCAGWDIAASGEFDLDISAFMLGADNKLANRAASDVIFYNNKQAAGIKLNGDNRTGAGDGDDEVISIALGAIPANVNKIVCCVTIHEAMARCQTFGMVQNSYVRLVNKDTGVELCKFTLKDNFSTETAVVFAELVRDNGSWVFHTIGDGKQADLNGLLNMFV